MTAPGKSPSEVLGVFRDSATAQAAADAAARISGRPPRLGDQLDDVDSAKAEMREELENTVAGPGNIGPFTKEMTKGLAVGAAAGVILGIIVTLPVGFIGWGSGLGLLPRLLIAVVVGGTAGATAGFVAGGGFGAKGPAEPLAAERGATVAMKVTSPEEATLVAEAMQAHDPIRVDLTTAAGEPVNTVTTEEEELRRSR